MGEENRTGAAEAPGVDDVREVEGFEVKGVLDAGETADGRLVLVLEVADGPIALSMDPKDAEHAVAVFLSQLPPTGGVEIVAEATMSGPVDVTGAEASPPEAVAATQAGKPEEAPFEIALARAAGEPLRVRMPTRTALRFARDLSRQLAAHLGRRSAAGR